MTINAEIKRMGRARDGIKNCLTHVLTGKHMYPPRNMAPKVVGSHF